MAREDFDRKAEVKAKALISKFNYERRKRRTFTYELTRDRIEIKARTSLKRAQEFLLEIMKLIR